MYLFRAKVLHLNMCVLVGLVGLVRVESSLRDPGVPELVITEPDRHLLERRSATRHKRSSGKVASLRSCVASSPGIGVHGMAGIAGGPL